MLLILASESEEIIDYRQVEAMRDIVTEHAPSSLLFITFLSLSFLFYCLAKRDYRKRNHIGCTNQSHTAAKAFDRSRFAGF